MFGRSAHGALVLTFPFLLAFLLYFGMPVSRQRMSRQLQTSEEDPRLSKTASSRFPLRSPTLNDTQQNEAVEKSTASKLALHSVTRISVT